MASNRASTTGVRGVGEGFGLLKINVWIMEDTAAASMPWRNAWRRPLWEATGVIGRARAVVVVACECGCGCGCEWWWGEDAV